MKTIKAITFWIGVNIIGIPEYTTHFVERRKYRGKEFIYTKSQKATL